MYPVGVNKNSGNECGGTLAGNYAPGYNQPQIGADLSPLQRTTDDLQAICNELHLELDTLSSRLSIIKNESPSEKVPNETSRSASCQLDAQIIAAIDNLRNLRRKIRANSEALCI